ncbi:putative 6-pyruvoyltetrahydropterin synthase [Gordonia polyisoprenivorans NBRC 16320 = JCM 10675]|uniref:6-carboxy-5,6,7,8-tetrahydropterin synthase n=1 Tax=Gordonia polyisoprenivorans TaxID=84595 RepID=A0A846WNJ5_9ACTN|nr:MULTISPECIES: 6-carboxytetrahydropterin synthase QueD [Gordonia]NKY01821.1 6-carboxytetrahydropterin synthase QueD [Gordonia polyisoprenivorans]OPX13526.1 6-carboxytetrahydropterin synthase QueD [Gordonia sp. i37]WCB36888.1 6-carboxytetrahydropterin synthase QueD [Gordonia polyisoprenivorans]GAB25114.1 putative 6-pyruvoyltetrahydropterin synthase [Gordonia polyisoprenivorans NBRC 16320 = JCM 10675]
MEIFREFEFEAAHYLPHVPHGHKCRNLHGHSYHVRIDVRGPIDPEHGWVLDYADIDHAFAGLHRQLDHHCLNDIEGLDNPTSEMLAIWIWDRLPADLPRTCVTVWESKRGGCVYRGHATEGA